MKKVYTLIVLLISCLFQAHYSSAQLVEWRLVNPTYSSVDPDGAGPATGVVTFTLQIHTAEGSIPNVNAISLGYSYQSAAAMVPTGTAGPGCPATATSPANIVLSPEFQNAGFVFNTVNQCNVTSQTTGGQLFDRTAAGTLFTGNPITLTTDWINVYTVTLWTLGTGFPEGGYVIINSGAGGTPGPLSSYEVSDNVGNPYVVNSLTFNTPLPLGSAIVPVLFSKFEAKCTNTGVVISWSTQQEVNNSRFELERSADGNSWATFSTVSAAGNSGVASNYQQVDLAAGASFYRIKQIDKDGHFMYTNVARVNCEVKNITSLLYPVPANDVLNVVIKSDRNSRTQLMVFDMNGKLVRRIDALIITGTNNFKINLSELASGDYILRSSDAMLKINKTFSIGR